MPGSAEELPSPALFPDSQGVQLPVEAAHTTWAHWLRLEGGVTFVVLPAVGCAQLLAPSILSDSFWSPIRVRMLQYIQDGTRKELFVARDGWGLLPWPTTRQMPMTWPPTHSPEESSKVSVCCMGDQRYLMSIHTIPCLPPKIKPESFWEADTPMNQE